MAADDTWKPQKPKLAPEHRALLRSLKKAGWNEFNAERALRKATSNPLDWTRKDWERHARRLAKLPQLYELFLENDENLTQKEIDGLREYAEYPHDYDVTPEGWLQRRNELIKAYDEGDLPQYLGMEKSKIFFLFGNLLDDTIGNTLDSL